MLLAATIALLSGGALRAAEPIPLRAGPLTMIFEPDNAFLRYIQLGPDEVLRGISAPVRNQHWGTVPPQVKIVSLEQKPDSFLLKFDVTCKEREIDFLWHGTIEGAADGKVVYTFDGTALSDFKRNRIGFCLLHGETAAGRPWVLETTGGETSKGTFPEFIAPHQPAKDLRSVAHEFSSGRWAHVQFAGDVFEMEDQRNWTDASFKTYCTPLAIPYPVTLKKGDKVEQKITIRLEGDIPKRPPLAESTSPITVTIKDTKATIPGIGLQLSSEKHELTSTEIERLKALQLDHLRVDLAPADENLSRVWSQATTQSKALNVKLIAALHLGKDPNAELKRVVAECQSVKADVSVWLIIAADQISFEKARTALKSQFPNAAFGVGHDTNFTELNRNRPNWKGIDVVSFGMNPQVHAFDNASMIETLPIQRDTVRSARHFLGDVPLIVGPVTLRVQQLSQQPLPGELPPNVDPRQASPFAAAWTLGSIKYLSDSHVSRVTYYETIGPKGLMAADQPTLPQDKFTAAPGEVYPLYHVFHAVGEFAGGEVHQTESTQPRSIVGLALSHGTRHRLLVANLTDKAQSVSVAGIHNRPTLVPLPLGEATPLNLGEPLTLRPFGTVMIDHFAD